MGDWGIPYVWIGDGAKYAGPASPQLFFRCVLASPTELRRWHQVRFVARLEHAHDRLFGIRADHGHLGNRPIISGDRWIPDVLCRNLPQMKGPHPLILGGAIPSTMK